MNPWQIRLCAAAAIMTLLFGAGGALAQRGPAAPSQQEIELKLRGLPKLGGTPAAAPSPNPAGIAPPKAEEPAPRARQRIATVTPPASPAATASKRPSMAFHTITFQFDSAELTPQSIQTLQNLGKAMNGGLKDVNRFVIEGHTDRVGTADYNKDLSQRRAAAVKTYLTDQIGVAGDRLEAVGVGFSDPIDPRRPYAPENRRVVVVNADPS